MKKIFVIFIIIISCNSVFSQILSYSVNDENAISKLKKYPIVYYLPKTNLSIDITITTSNFIPGPFANYADKYLLIKNVDNERNTNSYISNVKISNFSSADEENAYLAISDNFNLQLNSLGIISSYNIHTDTKDLKFEQIDNFTDQLDYYSTLFTNTSISSNFYNKTDTTYKVIQVDSVFEKVPIINKNLQSKTLEQKAEDVANFIIKIRNTRFQLQAGDFETDVPPTNVNELINELNILEKQYLELFIGKNVEIARDYKYVITPRSEGESLIGYLTETDGITNKKEENTQKISLNIRSLKTTSKLSDIFKKESLAKQAAGIYYRNPELCEISIRLEDKIISSKNIEVAQLGYLNYLPQKLFSDKKLKIIFNTDNGSIKSIFNE